MAKNILSVESLSVSFSGFTVLKELDFSIEYGEIRFLIGPNGAGKTTLLDIITGKTRPNQGRVTFDSNIELTRQQEHDLARLGIGRKFQTPTVFSSLTVRENLKVAVGFRNRTVALFRGLKRASDTRIQEVLTQIGLSHQADRLAGELAHGERQWLEIGMLLAQEPKLLLLDEPVAGMTRRERDHTGELLQSIGSTCSILVVEHDMEFVRQFAQKVTVLHLGSVLSEGSMEAVQQDPEVIRAYLGRSKEEQGQLSGVTAAKSPQRELTAVGV